MRLLFPTRTLRHVVAGTMLVFVLGLLTAGFITMPSCSTFDSQRTKATTDQLAAQETGINDVLKNPSLTAEQRATLEQLKADNAAALKQAQGAASKNEAASKDDGEAIVRGIADTIPVWGGLISGAIGIGYGVRRRILQSKAADEAEAAEAKRQRIASAFQQVVASLEYARQSVPAVGTAFDNKDAKMALMAKQDSFTQNLVQAVKSGQFTEVMPTGASSTATVAVS